MLSNPFSPTELIARSPNTPALQDDRPVNEYYMLREYFPENAETAGRSVGHCWWR